jgi:hypothetical protein
MKKLTPENYRFEDWDCSYNEARRIHRRAWSKQPPPELQPITPADNLAALNRRFPPPRHLAEGGVAYSFGVRLSPAAFAESPYAARNRREHRAATEARVNTITWEETP